MALLGAGTCVRLSASQMQVDDDGAQSAARPDVPSRGSSGSEAGGGFLLAATIALLMGRIPIIFIRAFDNDEFEHAHAAWSVFQGLLPYKDFFEHHTPWYYFALVAVLPLVRGRPVLRLRSTFPDLRAVPVAGADRAVGGPDLPRRACSAPADAWASWRRCSSSGSRC